MHSPIVFSHQKLDVYRKAVTVAADLGYLAADWDSKHSVADQLLRASESVVLNLAEAARLRSLSAKENTIDYAIGSALECAACVDIASVKDLLAADASYCEKARLCEVVKMLIGLRNSWGRAEVREETVEYGGESSASNPTLFGHERLLVYQKALNFIGWLHRIRRGPELSRHMDRQLDKAATSVVLNIAEGNGRRVAEDRRRFLDIAEAATIKAAAYLDLCQQRDGLHEAQATAGFRQLEEVACMLRGFVFD